VRRQALSSLSAVGAADHAAIDEALSDDDQRVRFAALTTRLGHGDVAARSRLQDLLLSDANEMSVEAARWALLNPVHGMCEAATGLLQRALAAALPQTRAQAAVALRSLPKEVLATVSAARLSEERDLNVRLQLSLRHMPSAEAKAVLVSLRDAKNAQVSLEAAVILAQAGDEAALARVLAARTDAKVGMRARAARALPSELGQYDQAVVLLADESARVRCAAAGALLTGLS
jgi:hypothetical protein